MKRSFLLLLAVACPLAAQLSSLATTDDGGVLYFSSSLRLRGTEQFSHEKIFRREGKDYQLVAQLERNYDVFAGLTNFFRLGSTSVSGDGRVVSYVGTRDCIGGSRCVNVELYQSTVMLPGVDKPLVLAGRVQLSRNGRYAVRLGLDVLFFR